MIFIRGNIYFLNISNWFVYLGSFPLLCHSKETKRTATSFKNHVIIKCSSLVFIFWCLLQLMVAGVAGVLGRPVVKPVAAD